MIFPAHRIREQLKKQADLTEEESRAIGRSMVSQAQGVIATEDFFYLQHRLGVGGTFLAAGGIGNFNQIALRNKATDPTEVIIRRIRFLNSMNVQLLFPADSGPMTVVGPGKLVDASFYIGQTAGGALNTPSGEILSRTAAGVLGVAIGMNIGTTGSFTQLELDWVLREGWALALSDGVANQFTSVCFDWREVDLRVR